MKMRGACLCPPARLPACPTGLEESKPKVSHDLFCCGLVLPRVAPYPLELHPVQADDRHLDDQDFELDLTV